MGFDVALAEGAEVVKDVAPKILQKVFSNGLKVLANVTEVMEKKIEDDVDITGSSEIKGTLSFVSYSH